jgi:hypothetical protein
MDEVETTQAFVSKPLIPVRGTASRTDHSTMDKARTDEAYDDCGDEYEGRRW